MSAIQTDRVVTGDALEVLAGLPSASVHAVVTDPPYGLAFMGRSWDDFEPREYQQWCREWATLALDVLKPGGHLLAFSGNRTHHRLFCGVEDAGFEVRDTLTWHYGCLSEDTEVLTPDGWWSHGEIAEGDDVVAFDPDTETFAAEPTARVFRYDHDGEMVRYQSPHTDQLVTPNHRVLHFRRGVWETIYAEQSNGIMELPVIHDRDIRPPEPQGRDHLREVRGDAPIPTGPRRRAELLFPGVLSGVAEGRLRHDGPPSGDSPQRARRVDREDYRVRPGEDDWRKQPGVEGRRDVQAPEGKLQAGDTGSVSPGVRRDGAGERLRSRASAESGEGTRPPAQVAGGSASHRPRQPQQRHRELGTLAEQPTSQTGRRGPGDVPVRTTLARTSRVDYSGTVWCVSVPSSYFVARRNGQVFITGNSGFPKALDVSKAIDKAAGGEREVVAVRERNGGPAGMTADKGWNDGPMADDDATVDVTDPATDAAREWDGWKTALKPATEFVVMARKPFDGTVAENVQEHGTAALNIDGTRIETNGETIITHGGGGDVDMRSMGGGQLNKGKADDNPREGRYPANVMFDVDAAGGLDREVGDLDPGAHTTGGVNTHVYGRRERPDDPDERYETDSGGPSRYFYTSKATKAERTENGRIANAHPTVKPQDLMEWLVKLVTAEGQIVLDPFAGSGTTLKAAKALGRRFVGIEQNPQWADVARVRAGLTPQDPAHVRDGDANQQGLEAFTDGSEPSDHER